MPASTRGALLERDTELREVADAVGAALAGRGELVVVEGSPGIGKSSMLDAAGAAAADRGVRTVRGRGFELERSVSFGVARQLLERAAGGAGPGATAAALSGEPLEPGTDELDLLHGLYRLTAAAAGEQPLLLVVDDLHWADPPSLRYLAYLTGRLADLPLCVLAAFRPGEPGAPDDLLARLSERRATRRLRLRPLSAGAAEQLVRRRLPEAHADFSRACLEATGGNPFYLGELLDALVSERVEPSAAAAGRVPRMTPERVTRQTLLRLSALSADARELAVAAALLGDAATLRRTSLLAGVPLARAAGAADELARAHLLREREPLRFTHPLLRAAVEAQLGAAERRLGHRRAAKLLAGDGAPAEQVAAYLLDASGAGEDWACEALAAAADEAAARGAPESAIRCLRRALEEPPPAARRGALLAALAEQEALTGDDGALGHLQQALALERDGGARARVLARLGWALYRAGRLVDARDMFARALAEPPGDPDLAAELATARLAIASLTDGGPAEETDDASGAVAGRPERERLTRLALRRVLAMEDARAARALARRALGDGAMVSAQGVSLSFTVAVSCLTWSDDLEGAAHEVEHGLADGRRRGSAMTAAYVLFGRSSIRYWRGRVADAAADAGGAVEAWRGGWSLHIPAAAQWHAFALVELGRLDEAAATLAAVDDDPRWAAGIYAVHLGMGRGRVALARGDYAAAAAELGRVADLAGRIPYAASSAIVPWRPYLAVATARGGDPQGGRRLAREDLAAARRFGAPRPVGMALWAAGVVEGGERGVARLGEAVAVLRGSQSTLELIRALCDLGALLRSRGRRLDARDPLREALDLAASTGATALAERARAELTATGARPRRAALSGRDALTPSELRVARLAAAGRSNPEIATELFISRKTVEYHLHGAYRKLGVSSRGELPARVGHGADEDGMRSPHPEGAP